jgi:hypothetical protein
MLKLLLKYRKNFQKKSKYPKRELTVSQIKRSRDEEITQFIVHHIGTN